MSIENGRMPEGLKELSEVAIHKQLVINERAELLNIRMQHFLRAFNGSVMDPDLIRERIQNVRTAWEQLEHLFDTIEKPYLD